MVKKEELLIAFSITLILFAMTNLGVVRAPPEETQGWVTDFQWVGDWNWGLSANSTGHWIFISGTPPRVYFDKWISEGIRGGGWGVWTEGNLQFWWRHDGFSDYMETDGNTITTQLYTGQNHLVNCTARSGFGNWIGQHWVANVSAQITI